MEVISCSSSGQPQTTSISEKEQLRQKAQASFSKYYTLREAQQTVIRALHPNRKGVPPLTCQALAAFLAGAPSKQPFKKPLHGADVWRTLFEGSPHFQGLQRSRALAKYALDGGQLLEIEKLNLEGTYLDDATLILLGSKLPNLKKITFANCPHISEQAIVQFLKNRTGVTELDLSGTDCSDANLTLIAQMLPSLTRLNLSNCNTGHGIPKLYSPFGNLTPSNFLNEKKISTEGIVAIATRCPRLISLNLTGTGTTDNGLTKIVQKCPHLSYLNVSECYQLTEMGFAAIADHLTNLTSLDASSDRITNTGLKAIAEGCRKLARLNLSDCRGLDGVGRKVITHCSQLDYLDLHKCRGFSNEGLAALMQCSLTYLDLRHTSPSQSITDAKLTEFAQHHSNLTTLSLANLDQVTDIGFTALAQNCTQLIHLELIGCAITNKGLAALGKYCPSLNFLNLSQCLQIADEGLKEIAAGCRQLTFLDLSAENGTLNRITGKGLEAILKGCPDLTELDLRAQSLITDETLLAIAKHCPKLTNLNLSQCKQITDEGLELAMLRLGHQLIRLDISGCQQITSKGLKAAIPHCPNLTHLNFTMQINYEMIIALVNNCPRLYPYNYDTKYQTALVDALFYGLDGVPKNIFRSLEFLNSLAHSYKPQAQAVLGSILFHGEGGAQKNVRKGLALLQIAAGWNNAYAKARLGNILFWGQGGVQQNIPTGFSLLQKATQKSDIFAQFALGKILLYGPYGITKNEQKGFELLQTAAQRGNADSQELIGMLLLHGEAGVQKDAIKGLSFLILAANQGSAKAQEQLKQTINTFFQLPTNQRNPDLQCLVGRILIHGLGGISQNKQKGFQLINKAAGKGHLQTRYRLARILTGGHGGDARDAARGHKFLSRVLNQLCAQNKTLVQNVRDYEQNTTYNLGEGRVLNQAQDQLDKQEQQLVANTLQALAKALKNLQELEQIEAQRARLGKHQAISPTQAPQAQRVGGNTSDRQQRALAPFQMQDSGASTSAPSSGTSQPQQRQSTRSSNHNLVQRSNVQRSKGKRTAAAVQTDQNPKEPPTKQRRVEYP